MDALQGNPDAIRTHVVSACVFPDGKEKATLLVAVVSPKSYLLESVEDVSNGDHG